MWWLHFLVVVLLDLYFQIIRKSAWNTFNLALSYTIYNQIIRNINGCQLDKAFWYAIWEIDQEWKWRPFIKYCVVDSNLPPSAEIFSRINMNQENTPEQHLILHSMCELSLLLIFSFVDFLSILSHSSFSSFLLNNSMHQNAKRSKRRTYTEKKV